MSLPHGTGTAAFYDVDGTLVNANVVHAFAYYALNQPTFTSTVKKTMKTVACLPAFWATDKLSRKYFNELFYRFYRGESEDRLIVLAEDMFEEVIKPRIFPGAKALIEDSRRAGVKQVIISGALDFTVRPLAEYLGMDDMIANKLEFSGGYATGRLGKPFVAGATKAVVLREYAARHGLDLGRCYAYSDSFSDIPMLVVCGQPAAVNPDMRLRAVARSYDWPVLQLS